MNIEKGIPFPSHSYGRYPFTQMEVGDSVLITGGKGEADKAYNAARSVGRYKKWGFSRRAISESETRIWRTR